MGKWLTSGEIDVIRGVNMVDKNQISMRTTPGYVQDPRVGQSNVIAP